MLFSPLRNFLISGMDEQFLHDGAAALTSGSKRLNLIAIGPLSELQKKVISVIISAAAQLKPIIDDGTADHIFLIASNIIILLFMVSFDVATQFFFGDFSVVVAALHARSLSNNIRHHHNYFLWFDMFDGILRPHPLGGI